MPKGKKTVESIWDAESISPDQKPVTREAVEKVEKKLKVKIPESLLLQLRIQNGGDVVPLPEVPWAEAIWEQGIYPIDWWMLGSKDEWIWGVDDVPDLKRLVVIAGADEYRLCLDYRECGPKGIPAVTLIDATDSFEIKDDLVFDTVDDFIVELLECKADAEDEEDNPFCEKLLRAVAMGDLKTVERVVQANKEILSASDWDGKTLLHFAIIKKQYLIVEYLIESGADINAENNRGETPLHQAVSLCPAKFAQLLIDNGADVDHQSDSGLTPLHWCVLQRDRKREANKIIEILITVGANLSILNSDGETPLQYGLRRNALEQVIKLLKRHGAK